MAKPLFLITVLMMFAVSAAAEIGLFLSFTTTAGDQLLAGMFGGALVLAQLLFADQAALRATAGQTGSAFFCGALAGLLLLISVIGTVVFFETRYQQQLAAATQNSDSYQLQKRLVQQSLESAAQLKQRAEQALQLNRITSAMQLTRQAAEIEQASAQQIGNITNQGNTTAKNPWGKWRWFAWALFAAVADLIGTYGVVLLRTWPTETKPKVQTKPTAETKQAPETKQTAETKQATETKQPNPKNKTGAEHWMLQHIKKHQQVPGVRDAKATGYTYGEFTRAVAGMIQLGLITPKASGKGWDVVSA